MRTAFLVVLILALASLPATPLSSHANGYEIAPHCDFSQRQHQNDDALAEVDVIYENGTYIQNATIHVEGYWGILRLANETWTHPVGCLTAIAQQEYAHWTVYVDGYAPVSWLWAPQKSGEYALTYFVYHSTGAEVLTYDGNAFASIVPEFPATVPVSVAVLLAALLAVARRRGGH